MAIHYGFFSMRMCMHSDLRTALSANISGARTVKFCIQIRTAVHGTPTGPTAAVCPKQADKNSNWGKNYPK